MAISPTTARWTRQIFRRWPQTSAKRFRRRPLPRHKPLPRLHLQPLEGRQLMSITPKFVEVPISSAAKTADPNLSNFKTFDLQVTLSGSTDWASADLVVKLTKGSFYNAPSDNADTAQQNLWGSEANLQFDTFVSGPSFGNPVFVLHSTYPKSAGGSAIFSSNTVDVSW